MKEVTQLISIFDIDVINLAFSCLYSHSEIQSIQCRITAILVSGVFF